MHGFNYVKIKIPELDLREQVKKQEIKELLNIINLQAVDLMFKRQKETWFSQSWYGTTSKKPNKESVLLMFKKIDNYLGNNPQHRSSYFFCTPKRVMEWMCSTGRKKTDTSDDTNEINRIEENTKTKFNYFRPRLKEPKLNKDEELKDTENEKDSKYQMWLPTSTRATNLYQNRTLCLYLMNVYPNWNVQKYLTDFHNPVDSDQYALSEMLQFIWRGCIRDGKPMDVYIASTRMKGLLLKWLEN